MLGQFTEKSVPLRFALLCKRLRKYVSLYAFMICVEAQAAFNSIDGGIRIKGDRVMAEQQRTGDRGPFEEYLGLCRDSFLGYRQIGDMGKFFCAGHPRCLSGVEQ